MSQRVDAIAERDLRPGSVVVGSVIAIFMSLVGFIVFSLALAFSQPLEFEADSTTDIYFFFGLAGAVATGTAIAAAVGAMRGSSAWRWVLVTLAGVTVLFCGYIAWHFTVSYFAPVAFGAMVWAAGAVLVARSMLTDDARAWFRRA